jgi:DNA-binding response OmpR family regulator
MRIIFLTSDPAFRTSLGERLQGEGFRVDFAGSVFEFYREMAVDGYDIAVIDMDILGSALDVVCWLRKKEAMGIVLLTPLGEVEARTEGYRRGSDLCPVKPVDGGELAAAIHSLGRRLGQKSASMRETSETRAHWLLDREHWLLQGPNGKSLKLSPAEMAVVERLTEQPGATIPRDELLTLLGYGHSKSGHQRLDTLISRFRDKIQSRLGCPAPVQTARGRGHLFSAPVRAVGALLPGTRAK